MNENALGISQYLEHEFGRKNVFIDVDMRAGAKFPAVLELRLAECKVMIVLIGRDWLNARNEQGLRAAAFRIASLVIGSPKAPSSAAAAACIRSANVSVFLPVLLLPKSAAICWNMGEYAVTAAMDTFVASKGDRHTTDLAMLQGKRLATASETNDGRYLDEARIKLLTGGDLMSARFMRQDNVTFRPQCKLFFIGNHMPQLRNVDPAMRRRMIIVPFVRAPANRDTQLETKLRSEAPRILRWMIEGCMDWQQNGLIVPESIHEMTDAYFSEQDLLGQWLSEKCDTAPGNNSKSETTANLYASWVEYAKRAGEDPGTVKSFSGKLTMRGFRRKATAKARMFTGLRLRPKHTLRILPPPKQPPQ